MFEFMNSMNGIFVIIGGNLGNRADYLQKCYALIEARIGVIIQSSSVHETEAWGKTDVPKYLNQVLQLVTHFSCEQLLHECLLIEQDMGRMRKEKWASRIIDIDILFFNQEVINKPNLIVPHIHLHERKFVLMPLLEIAPTFVHPRLKKTITELSAQFT